MHKLVCVKKNCTQETTNARKWPGIKQCVISSARIDVVCICMRLWYSLYISMYMYIYKYIFIYKYS